jgi:FkbM family methyltransferase
MVPTGLRTLAGDLRYQLRLRGGLACRLLYTALYWAGYLASRALGRDWSRAHGDAMERLGRWGLSGREVSVAVPGGPKLTIDLLTARMVLRELWLEDVYEVSPGRDFCPRPGETVFDVGAQQGVYALLAAAGSGGGRVIAFEPEPGNRARLERNVAANGARVTVVAQALSDKPKRTLLHRSRGNTGGHSLIAFEGAADAVEVPVSTLDAACEELGAWPALLKVDVEGRAPEVLAGGLKTLAERRPRVVMELENPGDLERARALLERLGYTLRSTGSIAFATPPAGPR